MQRSTGRTLALTMTILPLIVSCRGKSDTPPVNRIDPFVALQQISDALKTSPDNLPVRAAALVQEGDPVRIFEFVRDNIVVYPPRDDGFGYDSTTLARWGIRATLRGGAGTPREKVELLANLYTQAGFATQILKGRIDTTQVDFKGMFTAAVSPRIFSTNADDVTTNTWYASLGIDPVAANTPGPSFDPGGTVSAAIADSLETFFNPAVDATPFNWYTATDMPIVRVNVGGTWTFANPLVPGAEFGQHYMTATPVTAAAAMSPARSISIKLEAANTDDVTAKYTVLQRTWTADELAGRRLVLQFFPAMDDSQLLARTYDDVHAFIPTLRVEGADVDDAAREALSVVGTTINERGDAYELTPADQILVNGAPLLEGTGDASSVVSLSVEAIANHFPDVRLKVKALDAAGNPVDGLLAGNFTINEDGQERQFMLQRNVAPAPKVLLIFDSSTSIPAAFRNDGTTQNLTAFGTQMITTLQTQNPGASFRVSTIDAGDLVYKGNWSQDPVYLETQLDSIGTCGFDCSYLWKAASRAAGSGATAVVFVTDGAALDTAADKALYKSRMDPTPPFVMIGVAADTAQEQATLQEMADITGGASSIVSGTSEALAAVTGFIDVAKSVGYEIVYRAELDGPTLRTVDLALLTSAVASQTTYTAPPPAERLQPKRLSGLYLTVTVDGRTVRQTIAGAHYRCGGPEAGYSASAPCPITDAQLDDVNEMLFGRITFAFEGAAPMLSVWFDDFVRQQLTLKPLVDAVNSGDSDAARAALMKGFERTPLELFLLMKEAPGQYGEGVRTFETGPRVIAIREIPRFGVGWETKIDMFARNTWVTVSTDEATAWRKNMERTLYHSLHEAFLLDTSTRSLLEGQLLQSHPVSQVVAGLGPTWPDNPTKRTWVRMAADLALSSPRDDMYLSMLMPTAFTPDAFWLVDKRNGTTAGILPDVTGGATETEINTELNRNVALGDGLTVFGCLVECTPVVGVWATLEKTKARLVTQATIMLATMKPVSIDWAQEGRNILCDMAKTGASEVQGVSRIVDLDGYVSIARGLGGHSGGFLQYGVNGC